MLMTRQTITSRIQNHKISKLIQNRKAARLKDGGANIQKLTPDCAPDIFEMYTNLSIQSRQARFNSDLSIFSDAFLQQLAKQTAELEPKDGFGFIAYDEETGRPIGVAQAVQTESRAAEFAITIVDDHQGQGLGTILFKKLVERAQADNLNLLEAIVSPDNRGMHMLLMKSGLPQTIDYMSNTMVYKLYINGRMC
ncbi:MAG: GNAT family N-acetyltransferase [Chloroflexota bacterium]